MRKNSHLSFMKKNHFIALRLTEITITAFASVILLLLIGCEKNWQPQSNQQMAQTLTELAQKAEASEDYPYFNDYSVAKLKRGLQGMPMMLKERKMLDYLLLLLMQGDNATCITEVNEYLKQTNGLESINKRNWFYYKILAMAHLRAAEIYNCVNNHSNNACVLPIAGDGIHQMTDDTEMAANLYLKLCQFDTTDLQSRWYYNLAHMAMGNYPQGVQAQFRIPEEVFESEYDIPKFQNIGMQSGTAVNNHAGSANLFDFNNDGYLDILTSSYSLGDLTKYFENDQKGGFIDKSEQVGLEGYTGGLNAVHGDVNNDGWTDVLILRGAWLRKHGQMPNSLLLNREGKYFEDVTESSGIMTNHPTGTAAFADINLDGHLDIFIGNEHDRYNHHPCEMYVNNGDGTFSNYAEQLGIDIKAFVKGAVWGDINGDMLPDLFLSVFGEQNVLLVNRGGKDLNNWKFENITEKSNVREPKMSFPTWFWDFDNDGLEDIMVFGYDNNYSHLIPEKTLKGYLNENVSTIYPRLYKNLGQEQFKDVSDEANLRRTVFPMGANFGDLDNDGYSDFYLGTGEFNIWAQVPNRMFRNNKGVAFQDVTTAGGFGQIQKGHGVAFGDIDNDGDQDIYHQVGGAAQSDVFHNMLFENPGFDNDWITLRLQGVTANRSAIGAKISVYGTNHQNQPYVTHKRVSTGGSFGANPLRAEIGLARCQKIDSLIVQWPDKNKGVQKFFDVEPNAFYLLEQGKQLLKQQFIPINEKENKSHHMTSLISQCD